MLAGVLAANAAIAAAAAAPAAVVLGLHTHSIPQALHTFTHTHSHSHTFGHVRVQVEAFSFNPCRNDSLNQAVTNKCPKFKTLVTSPLKMVFLGLLLGVDRTGHYVTCLALPCLSAHS